ncbi:MAG: ABC transporter permease [Acidimicrobiales bacterium]|nr:ABC transporter permease [Acidimicrobiales bacterium]
MSGARFGFIWLATLRDLQWRWRRFVMAVLAISLVFAITLLLSGFGESFRVEAHRLTSLVGADGYVVQTGSTGPFTSPRPFRDDAVSAISASSGIRSATPLIALLQPDIYLLARPPEKPAGHVVADGTFRGDLGEPITIGLKDFTVSELASGRTVFGGVPIVEVSVTDAQASVFAGQPFITAVAVMGEPTSLPDGYLYVSSAAAETDFLRPVGVIRTSIRILSGMLWVVAAAIVGTLVYVSTLERLRDLAVYKATGAATGDLLAALVFQAVLISLVAASVAIGLAYATAPVFPRPVYFPATVLLTLPTVGLVVGLIASAAGLRRAVRVDPAVAMGASGG